MIKIFGLIALALGLGGCASTPSELISKGPDLTINSKKSASKVSGCIHERWEDTRGVSVSSRETSNGYRVILIRESELGQMVDVEYLSTGSISKFYNRHYVIGDNLWLTAVKECQ